MDNKKSPLGNASDPFVRPKHTADPQKTEISLFSAKENKTMDRLNKELDATLDQAKILKDSEAAVKKSEKATASAPQNNKDFLRKNTVKAAEIKTNATTATAVKTPEKSADPKPSVTVNKESLLKSGEMKAQAAETTKESSVTPTAEKTAPAAEQSFKDLNEESRKDADSDSKPNEIKTDHIDTIKHETLPMTDNTDKTTPVTPLPPDSNLSNQLNSLKGRVNFLTCLIILIIGGACYGTYYLDQQKYTEIVDLKSQLLNSTATVKNSEDRINDLYSQIKAKDERVTNLLLSNDEIKNQNNLLKNNEDNLKKQADNILKLTEDINIRLNNYEARNPNDWLLAQSFFLVSNAQNILSFTDNVNAALLNLNNADLLLVKIDEASVNQVREAISKDILTLKNLAHIDFKGISYKIDSVYDNLQAMPLNEYLDEKQKATAFEKNEITTDNVKDWKENLINSLKDFSSRFIEIRRHDENMVNMFLSPQQSSILLQNLKTELLLSKVALFNHDQEAFVKNLNDVGNYIASFYDLNNAVVKANLETLRELSGKDIKLAKPEQLSSYELFNTLASSRFNLYSTQKKSLTPSTESQQVQKGNEAQEINVNQTESKNRSNKNKAPSHSLASEK